MADVSRHLVIDGSNIATEGRSLPSLAQLDEAVRELVKERPFETWTVVVDATFGHRIDMLEKQTYEEALAANELVTPPAGTIGRGDKFLLEIADRSNAIVFSNDSFQEFHGEYDWLFDEGRLIGGKPVPEVGWIFTERTPVRGPKSRMSTRGGDRRGRLSAPGRSGGTRRVLAATGPLPVPTRPPPRPPRREPVRAPRAAAVPEPASEPVEIEREAPASRRRSSSSSSTQAVNEPLPFIEFIAEHGLGQQVQGEVLTFTSHGAFVQVGDVRCYLALKFMGDPAPRSARDVLGRGEVATFVVQAIDAPRRGIDLALPGFEDLDEDRAPMREPAASDETAPDAPSRPTRTRTRTRTRKAAISAGGGDAAPVSTPAPTPASTPSVTPSVEDRPSRTRRTRTVAAAPDLAPAEVSTSEADGRGVEEEVAAPTEARKRAPRKRAPGRASARVTVPTGTVPSEEEPSGKVPTGTEPAVPAAATSVPGEEVPAKKVPARRVAKRAAAKQVVAKRTATKRAATVAPATDLAPSGHSVEPGFGETPSSKVISTEGSPPSGFDPGDAPAATEALAQERRVIKSVTATSATESAVTETAAEAEPAGEVPARKAAAKKAPAKKAAVKATARKAAAKKAAAAKAGTKKQAAKQQAAKQQAAKQQAVKKATARKAAAKKVAVKATATKVPAKRATTKPPSSRISPATDASPAATTATASDVLDATQAPEEA